MIRKLFAGAFALVVATCALAPASAGNLAVTDANLARQYLCEKAATDGSLVACHAVFDTTLTQIDPATKQLQQAEITALGSLLQAGGSVGISGSLPGFATTPTFNIGTAPAFILGAGSAKIGTVDTVVQGTATDIGATVSAATATVLAASNTSRRGFSVQNQTTGNCWLNGVSTPTGTYHDLLIQAGSYYESKDSYVGTGAIQIYCAAAGGVYGRQW